jgi:hypothetical protein
MQQEMWGELMANMGMEEMVKDHEKRILQLEQSYAEVKREMTNLSTSQLRIENAVLNVQMEAKETRQEQKELFYKLIDQKYDLEKTNANQTFEIQKTNLTNRWQLFFTLLGSGGIIVAIVEFFLKH